MQPPPAQGIPLVQRQQLFTLRYNGAAPPPHPPCLDPTPDEEYQMLEQNRQAQAQQKELAHQQQQQQQPQQSKGGFGSLVKLATSVAAVVEKTAGDLHAKGESKARNLYQQKIYERFQVNFPELAAGGIEAVYCEYSCRVMHQGQQVAGNIQITSRNVLFWNDQFREIIPLTEIATIVRSNALETADNGPPFIMPIPAPNVLPDCLQLFTVRTMQIFQFLNFESAASSVGQVLTSTIKGRCIDRAYNFLDHSWRKATPVPVPGVQYAPAY